jgi:hypothetical protein
LLDVSRTPDEDFKVISSDLDDQDPLAGINLLKQRANTIGERLRNLRNLIINGIDSLVNPTLIARRAILLELGELKRVILERSNSISNYEFDQWEKSAVILDKMKNSDDEFRTFLDTSGSFTQEINSIRELDPQSPNYEEQLENKLDTLQSRLDIIYTQLNEAFTLTINQFLGYLWEASRYGFEKAMTPLPKDFELVNAKPFFEMIEKVCTFLQEKLEKLSGGLAQLDQEITRLETEVESGNINPLTWQDMKTEKLLTRAISLLQDVTDGQRMVIFTPYLLNDPQEWYLDLTQFSQSSSIYSSLSDYGKVRRAVSEVLELYQQTDTIYLYEDRSKRPLDPTIDSESDGVNLGHTDYLYLAPFQQTEMKCFTCLLIDEWQEFFPDMVQTTGISYRYDAPQAEAPNAIIIAVPPDQRDHKLWPDEIYANTILETIELMQIRTVGTQEIAKSEFAKYLPTLLFGPGKLNIRRFPPRETLVPFMPHFPYIPTSIGGPSYIYADIADISEHVTLDDWKKIIPEVKASRKMNPKIGGNKNES